MFDVSFSEILVVFVIALIVIGPEKLPTVARKFGKIMARFRKYVGKVRQEIDKELQLDELQNLKTNLYQQTQQIQQELSNTKENISAEFKNFANDIQAEIYKQQQQQMQNQPLQQQRPYDDFCGPMPKIDK